MNIPKGKQCPVACWKDIDTAPCPRQLIDGCRSLVLLLVWWDIEGERFGWIEKMVKGLWDFWNHTSHTSIRKSNNWQMYCNHQNEERGKVTGTQTWAASTEKAGSRCLTIHIPAEAARKDEMHTRGQRDLHSLCSQGVSSPHSYSWQENRPFQKWWVFFF